MKPISEVLSSYKSLYAAEKNLGIFAAQLKRWADNDALVDAEGNVWIRTGKQKLRVWPETDERIDNIGVNGPSGCHYQASDHLK